MCRNLCETNNVIVRVHEQDNITNNDSVTIFDPWRSYPKAKNVVYYGDTKNV